MKNARRYQEEKVKQFKAWYNTRKEKQKRMLRLIPMVIIYMSIIVYLSGFLQFQEDFIVFIIGAIALGLFCVIFPMEKLLR